MFSLPSVRMASIFHGMSIHLINKIKHRDYSALDRTNLAGIDFCHYRLLQVFSKPGEGDCQRRHLGSRLCTASHQNNSRGRVA